MYLTSDKNPSKVKELQKLMREHPDYPIIIRNEPTDGICIDALFNTYSEIINVYIGKICETNNAFYESESLWIWDYLNTHRDSTEEEAQEQCERENWQPVIFVETAFI